MARYLDPSCKLCRREGTKLFLKGSRCLSPKCAIDRRSYPPGQHGQARIRSSEYNVQLREKQKLRRIYGLLERQFRQCFARAERSSGVTGENLLTSLELRLDNVVYRLSLASSRKQARMLVRQNHFMVNGKGVNLPSYLVRVNDLVEVKEGSRQLAPVRLALEGAGSRHVPDWLVLNHHALNGRVQRLPTKEEIAVPVKEQMVVELYSR